MVGATMANDEAGYRISLVLFTVAIPAIFGVAMWLASSMPH